MPRTTCALVGLVLVAGLATSTPAQLQVVFTGSVGAAAAVPNPACAPPGPGGFCNLNGCFNYSTPTTANLSFLLDRLPVGFGDLCEIETVVFVFDVGTSGPGPGPVYLPLTNPIPFFQFNSLSFFPTGTVCPMSCPGCPAGSSITGPAPPTGAQTATQFIANVLATPPFSGTVWTVQAAVIMSNGVFFTSNALNFTITC